MIMTGRCRRAVVVGLAGLVCGCVWTDPQERRWRRQISEEKPRARWVWETPSRLEFTGLPWPYTLSYNHDRVRAGCVVAQDYLLLIASQGWEFYQPDNDRLYVIRLSSGELVREMQAHYYVSQLFCGQGQYAAYVGVQYDAARRRTKEVLVIRSFPSGDQMDEASIDSLGLRDEIRTIRVEGGLVIAQDHEGNVAHRSLADWSPGGSRFVEVPASGPAAAGGTHEKLAPVFMAPATLAWRDAAIHMWSVGVSARGGETGIAPSNLRKEDANGMGLGTRTQPDSTGCDEDGARRD